jgi:hypothetical protein
MDIGRTRISASQLIEVAIRVLSCCAKGSHPNTRDIKCLERYALPGEDRMGAAELAGSMIWRMQKANEMINDGAS